MQLIASHGPWPVGAVDKTGQDRTGQDRTGEDRRGQDRTGQDRTGQDRTGKWGGHAVQYLKPGDPAS
jgi:hypothetical protein